MKKTLLIILLSSFISSVFAAESIMLKTGKDSYLRYEIVDIYCSYTEAPKKKQLINMPILIH